MRKKYHSLSDDLTQLKSELLTNPFLGIDLGQGLRKIRITITSKNKGKSHGAHVITHVIINVEDTTITLLTIYDKGKQDTISNSELVALILTESIFTCNDE
ncbi:hypothetical protein AGMMS50239_19900 [Bacteroidia bacterium]|nr:hypothetical protein AGMMS50239_19900 [Bacteroidia bacterium]